MGDWCDAQSVEMLCKKSYRRRGKFSHYGKLTGPRSMPTDNGSSEGLLNLVASLVFGLLRVKAELYEQDRFL